MNLLPISTGQIKDRTCDWAVEWKGGIGGLREWKKEGEGQRKRRWKEAGAELPGPEAASSKGSHCWGIEQCSGQSAQSRRAAYMNCN